MSTPARPGLLSGNLLWATVGTNALIFLGAFDSLAVTTIMPTVARELDGDQLFSAAFAATLAAGVIGMVVGGAWSDRRGPVAPLVAAAAVFVVGLVVSAVAPTMPVFVLGRFLQGLGNGTVIVAIYVIVARLYPEELRPRIFASFAAAWVLPGLVGPALAGIVSDSIGWPWVFAGTAALTAIAVAATIPALRSVREAPVPERDEEAPGVPLTRRILLSVVVAAAVLGVSVTAELPLAAAWPLAAVGAVVVVVAIRPLVPRGTLSGRTAIGATVLARAGVAAAFFATEARLPYLLQHQHGLPAWQSGLVLTVGALSWAGASQVMGRLSTRVDTARAMTLGSVLLTIGVATETVAAALELSPVVAMVGWLFAAAGMGTVYPLISTLLLAYSAPHEQGFNSSALSIAESVAGAVGIALAGLVFLSAGGADAPAAFALAFGLAAVAAAVSIVIGRRIARV